MKRFLTLTLALLVALSALLVTAAPALACTPGSRLTMTASALEVSPGGSVTLRITEQNTGDVPATALTGVYVELSYGSTTDRLDRTTPGFDVSSDPANPVVLDFGEAWRWEVTRTVNATTVFTAIAHGFYRGTDITYPDYPERAQVTVTVRGGGEGCTPGYWKNNWDKWEGVSWEPTGYSGGDLFSAVFGRTIEVTVGRRVITNPTLFQALNAQGGGINALARHAVAALLNAASPDVDYDYGVAAVKSMVQGALPDGDIDGVKDDLADANEAGCPIDQHSGCGYRWSWCGHSIGGRYHFFGSYRCR